MLLSSDFSSFTRRKMAILVIAILVILVVVWLVYSLYIIVPSTEKTAAEQVAEEVAKAENPFKADNPLSTVETNPFEKVKKVLNPFEQ
ncbi:MAG: hypothetical protein HYT69_02575 [Candidatus Zambryskibacteria bacterium]|nr:hypothetical protein [Candidatus Zambryskibacteria bacterium]